MRCSSEPGQDWNPSFPATAPPCCPSMAAQEHNREGPEPQFWKRHWGGGRAGTVKKFLPGPAQSIKLSGSFTAWGGGGFGVTQATDGSVGLRPAWPELWPKALGLGWTGGWRYVLSSQGRHPAGWVLPQPCLPPVPNPSPFFLLLDCWSLPLPSFQLCPVTTDPWPWTDQTSTKNKSLF